MKADDDKKGGLKQRQSHHWYSENRIKDRMFILTGPGDAMNLLGVAGREGLWSTIPGLQQKIHAPGQP